MQNKNYSLYRPENPTVREAYSMLAGNIHVGSEQKKIKSLVITSVEPKIGKTSIATSLAITMATWGKRTLLVDADLRKQSDKSQLNALGVKGTYQYLQGIISFEDVLCSTNIDNLVYIPNGRVSGNPMGILCSKNLTDLIDIAGQHFDYIIFDTPSLGSVSDAAIISSKTDATILVASLGKTKLGVIKQAKETIEKNNGNLLGVVVNRVKKSEYRRYFESYDYFYKSHKNAVREDNHKVLETLQT